MATEFDLIFNYKNAPAELQKAAEAQQAALKAMKKANKSVADAKAEMALATSTLNETSAAYQKQLASWDPEAVKAVK